LFKVKTTEAAKAEAAKAEAASFTIKYECANQSSNNIERIRHGEHQRAIRA